jgi:hypothetical protein
MKNILRFLGIIVLAAVIGFSMTACKNGEDGGDSGNNSGNDSGNNGDNNNNNNNGNNGGNNNNNNGGNDGGTPTTTTYTVTFDANGGSGTAPSAQTVQAGSSITLPGGDGLTKTGRNFGGWNTITSGAGTNYNAGASYTVNNNITLYARWSALYPNLEEGIHVGLIKFAGDAENLHISNMHLFLDLSGKTTLNNLLDTKYVIAEQSGTAMFYGIHKAIAFLSGVGNQYYPANLDSVNIITFTDGLDNASSGRSADSQLEGFTADTAADYKSYISYRIANERIAGIPITAYSVGVPASDVTDMQAFQSNLQAIASAPANSYVLSSFSQLENTFEDIAKKLDISRSSTNFTLTTTLLDNGAKVRMTFDATTSAPASTTYIEGVINRTGGVGIDGNLATYTLTNIVYSSGISSDQGSGPITGIKNGSEVSFEFTNVTGYSAIADTDPKQWLMYPGTSTWQINSEYSSTGWNTPSVEKHSVVIYLILDCSTSLSSANIDSIREAAKEFIEIMYNGYYNNPNP